MSQKIQMTIEELQSLLNQQKFNCANYIRRNLSTYSFYEKAIVGNNIIDKVKNELFDECMKADSPQDFEVLKKYLK